MSDTDSTNSAGGFTAKMSFNVGNVADQWKMFKRQLSYYLDSKFTDKQLTEKKQIGVLMTALGREGIEIYDTLFPPTATPKFDAIITAFDTYCNPRKNTVFDRSVYFSLRQKADQTVDSFVLELRRQAQLCEFEEKERDKLLRDILVIGIRDQKLKEELLRDPDLDLPKAIEACKSRERSQREASQMVSSAGSSLAVDRVETKQRSFVGPKINPCPNCSYLHGNCRPCPAIKENCKTCGVKGHFMKVCPTRSSATKPVRAIETPVNVEADSQKVDLLQIYACQQVQAVAANIERAWYVDLVLGNTSCKFKLDTAAECDTLSATTYYSLSPRPPLLTSKSLIKPYNAPAFRPLGRVVVTCRNQKFEFLVMPGREENLLGFQSCKRLGLIARVSSIKAFHSKESFIKTNQDLFQGVGQIPGLNTLYTDPQVAPTVARPRKFAYALSDRIVKTLREMWGQEIIVPVRVPTDWTSNITIVEKSDGTLRVCLDPQKLNKALRIPKYSIPKTDDILVHLANKKLFTVIDLKSGFWHMQLDEESSYLTTFNSPIGRFRFKRLCFGINCAPEMFMAEMVRIFGTIKNVYPYFDDLIVATETLDEHDIALELLCSRAREYNIKFNPDKLQYKQSSVQFLGLIVSSDGVKPAQKHIRAMIEMPTPADKPAILRFLGLVKFLSRFIPNVSALTANLRALTKKDVDFAWTTAHEGEFQHLKNLIAEKPVLTYFTTDKPIVVQTDSSKDGLGSVLLQEDQPVAFASRALTPAEVKYSQIEKELLAIVFAMERFHEYVYGMPVVVQSDHRPLESILKKDLEKVSPRLQRLRLRLLKYNVDVRYTPGKQLLVADALSRAFLPDETPNLEYQSVNVHTVKSMAISAEKTQWLADKTQADPQLATVRDWIESNSWPEAQSTMAASFAKYFSLKPSLSVANGLIFLEDRLVIPSAARTFFLEKLHEGHLSAEKMKRLARETVYWPGITADVVVHVAHCTVCQKFAKNNVKQPLQPYPLAEYPWQQLALDIASFEGRDYLVVVDKFSNWPEVLPISSKSAPEVVTHLRKLFACHGIPEIIISDNNPFNSQCYLEFAKEWGFQPIFTSPHFAQSNGHAERTVQTMKMLLKKCKEDGSSLQYALLQYRNTPLADTNFSPAQILLGRRLRTKLPVATQTLHPQLVPRDVLLASKERSQESQKFYYDQSSSELPELHTGQPVWVKDDLAQKQWQPAVVQDKGPNPRSFIIEKEGGGGTVTRNRRFLRPRANIAAPARYRA